MSKDERDQSGLRAVLNFGHTFGHAFETLLGYGTLLHGEAVAIGMVSPPGWPSGSAVLTPDSPLGCARSCKLSACRWMFPQLDAGKIVDAMMHDKKVEYGRLRCRLAELSGPSGAGGRNRCMCRAISVAH